MYVCTVHYFVCIGVRMCVCMYIYVLMYACIHVLMRVCIGKYIFQYVGIHICMYLCMYDSMYA